MATPDKLEQHEVRLDELEAETTSLRKTLIAEANESAAFRARAKLYNGLQLAGTVIALGGMILLNSKQSKKIHDANRKINELQEKVGGQQ